jgi:hypothetical protein
LRSQVLAVPSNSPFTTWHPHYQSYKTKRKKRKEEKKRKRELEKKIEKETYRETTGKMAGMKLLSRALGLVLFDTWISLTRSHNKAHVIAHSVIRT